MSKKVYQIVTDRIIKQLEKGTVPWQKVWREYDPSCNFLTKKPYRGCNVLLTSFHEFNSNYFLTYKQCKELGGTVKKGESGLPILFWNFVEKKDGDNKTKKIPFLRYYTVFNIDQCEGGKKIEEEKKRNEKIARKFQNDKCDKIINDFVEKTGIKIKQAPYGVSGARYYPKLDYIEVQDKKYFNSVEEYYTTLFHEMVHSTGHESRCNRKMEQETEKYSKEELIAEIGAAFLSNICGINTEKTMDNSAGYIDFYKNLLKGDNEIIVKASSKAQKAVDYILNYKPEVLNEDDE